MRTKKKTVEQEKNRNSQKSVSDCQTPTGQIPADEHEQGIDGYEGKDVEKRKVLRPEQKTPRETRKQAMWNSDQAWK